MLAKIGDVIPRFQIYERLFPSHLHLRLTQALSNAYLDVLRFCFVVKRAFRKATWNAGKICPSKGLNAIADHNSPAISVRILLKVSWQSVDKQFEKLIGQFNLHRKSVEKEAELANMIEQGNAREAEKANLVRSKEEKAGTYQESNDAVKA